ncbi:MAG: SGNH/GDSL hydrolase family protein [Victivallales bacterium]|nr:SGNH/GDSL hydrolase family protein [Victivallales bacterium]
MNLTRHILLTCALAFACLGQNLLQNPTFEFHSFDNHRLGKAISFTSKSVAFWHHNTYGDITVTREAHIAASKRPAYSVQNIVSVAPGKSFHQVIPLCEAGLSHGEVLSLAVNGWQSAPKGAVATVELLKIDSEDGTWTPGDFGYSDKRTFPKHARGELIVAKTYSGDADATGAFRITIPTITLEGHFTDGEESHTGDMNTVAIRITLANASEKGEVLYWAPALVKGEMPTANVVPSVRPMEPMFRHIPKTMQKLWKGESLHIILMGSSIDRGSANPPMYLYDENPASETFKQPISERVFEAEKIGRPDLDGYFGWWQHYFSYGGRLRLELMRKFNLPVSKLCLNIMACDGSNIGEAMSGLDTYCTLAQQPSEGNNGHKTGTTWKELYPELFTRPQGTAPDLVIFGSGANEKTDTPEECALFEASIRWIQQRYPDTEFIFCMFQNKGGYTPNPGDLQALALRYQIPFMDFGKLNDDMTRHCNPRTLVPRDGHPQAVGHFFWAYCLEKAFECWDPVPAGQAQLRLPSRMHKNTIGWEGIITFYPKESPRFINGTTFIIDDMAFNLWATGGTDKQRGDVFVDGNKVGSYRPQGYIDVRNSSFRHGNVSLGDRHIVELTGENAALVAVEMKTIAGRCFYPVTSALWNKKGDAAPFESKWGAPYGDAQLLLQPGESAEITLPGTDFSIAFCDALEGGKLLVSVDGQEKLSVETNAPFKFQDGTEQYLENRRAICGLAYGMHTITVKAEGTPVALLGIFTYDTRPNKERERIVNGVAAPGEKVVFVPPFKATPVIHAFGGLKLREATPDHALFEAQDKGAGSFMAVGE